MSDISNIRSNINSSLTNRIIGDKNPNSIPPYKVGKVVEILINDTTPNPNLFIRDGGWNAVGTIYYVEYPQGTNVNEDLKNINLFTLPKAKPLFPNIKHIPVKEELVLIFSTPEDEEYYISSLNLFNNANHNSLGTNLGKTFEASKDGRSIALFEGDSVYESRFGSSLHFTSTNKSTFQFGNERTNWWSTVGKNGDPITFLTNGYYLDSEDYRSHIEDLKNDKSSIVLTSSQRIPLNRELKKQNIFKVIGVDDYSNSQVILNSDRIILNAKKDSILGFADYIGLSSKYSTYIESNEFTVNANLINLGVKNKNAPVEPVLLGHKTTALLVNLITMLKSLGKDLGKAVATDKGTPIPEIQKGGQDLLVHLQSLEELYGLDLTKIKSNITYTV